MLRAINMAPEGILRGIYPGFGVKSGPGAKFPQGLVPIVGLGSAFAGDMDEISPAGNHLVSEFRRLIGRLWDRRITDGGLGGLGLLGGGMLRFLGHDMDSLQLIGRRLWRNPLVAERHECGI